LIRQLAEAKNPPLRQAAKRYHKNKPKYEKFIFRFHQTALTKNINLTGK